MKLLHILMVEDNEGDILLTKEAFENSHVIHKLSIVRDGSEAIEFLGKKGKYRDFEAPNLLLLDLNLPKKNGHEVLEFIRADENLKSFPVIIFSTSSSLSDIHLSYKNEANCYITKPVDSDSFSNVVAQVEKFWNSIN